MALVERPKSCRWQAETANDPLTDVAALGRHVRNWRALLRHGVELADAGGEAEAMAETIEARLRTGRPLAAEQWIETQEEALDRRLAPQKRGPKPTRHN